MLDEEKLKDRVSANEGWSKFSGWVVVAGLLIEIGLAAAFREHKYWVENWAPVLADVLVALGVYGEIHFSGKVSKAEEALRQISDQNVANANERAAAAQRDTERLRVQFGWRRLSSKAIKLLSDSLRESHQSLREYRHRQVSITYFGSDPESSNFAHELGSQFLEDGWTVRYVSALYTGRIVFGLLVPHLAYSDNTMVNIARAALSSARIEFKEDEFPMAVMSNPEPGSIVGNNAVRIYVGPKPMPEPF
jgi:hypothetical protein